MTDMNLTYGCTEATCTATTTATTAVLLDNGIGIMSNTTLAEWNQNVSSIGNGSSKETSPKTQSLKLDEYLWIYVSPFVFVIGVCGNSLTMAVMTQKRLRGSTTGVYMPLIAIFDTLALITGIVPEWLEACGFLVFNKLHPWTCKLEKFSFYTTSDIAIWTLVLFTTDRLIAVRFPLKKSLVCVPKRAVVACGVMTLVCAVKNFHVFWTRGAEFKAFGVLASNCGRPQPYTDFELHIRPWIALALVNALPFIILVTSNSMIIWTLAIVSRIRFESKSAGGVTAGGGAAGGGRSKNFNQTTMMCLSASFAFLICVTPSMVTLIGRPYWTTKRNPAYDVAKAINNQLAYLNHAINFFLYCLTGQKFREQLVYLICRSRRQISYGETPTWQTYLSDARPLRKGVARGLDTAKISIIRPLTTVVLKVDESEF